mmetsp:Transcript_18636/g.33635  ORF Transcript_18636/g.33635 Transcript_18636/m.33635 type:complete len:325 (+) Transcript_18636:108-1082(+)
MLTRKRLSNLLPPGLICSVFSTIWATHALLHLHPLLWEQKYLPRDVSTGQERSFRWAGEWTGWAETAISQLCALMVVITYNLAVFTHPGMVPDSAEWKLDAVEGADAGAGSSLPATREYKASGNRRFCKWCRVYKPDRTHHCRVCKSCVLRMDHHCPWIMNCVGYRNHKYFMLLVIYAWFGCTFYATTLVQSVVFAAYQETLEMHRFFIVFAETLSVMMCVLLTAFLLFHLWLTARGLTTIEFCEKSFTNSSSITYNLGIWRNLKAVFGDKVWLWLCPFARPSGDGVRFEVAPDQVSYHQRTSTATSSIYHLSSSSPATSLTRG